MSEPRKGSRGAGRGPTQGAVPKTPRKVPPKPKPIKPGAWARGAAAPASIFYPDALTQPKKPTRQTPRSVVITKPAPVAPRPTIAEKARLADERRGLSLGVKGIDPSRQPKQDLRSVPVPRAPKPSMIGTLLHGATYPIRNPIATAKAPGRAAVEIGKAWFEGVDQAPASYERNAIRFGKWYGRGGLFARTAEVARAAASGEDTKAFWDPRVALGAFATDLVGVGVGEETQEWVMNRFRDRKDRDANPWMVGVEMVTALPFLRGASAVLKGAKALRAGDTLAKAIFIANDAFPTEQPVLAGVRAVARTARGDRVRGERVFQVGSLVKAADQSESPVGRAIEDVADAARSQRSIERRVGSEIKRLNTTRRKQYERGVPNLRKALTKVSRGKQADAETFALRLALNATDPVESATFHLRKAMEAGQAGDEAAAVRHMIFSNLATAASEIVRVTDEGIEWLPQSSPAAREAHRLISEVTAPTREEFIRNLNLVTDEQIRLRAESPRRVMNGAEWQAYQDIYRTAMRENPSRERFRQGLIADGRSEEEANAIVNILDMVNLAFIQARHSEARPQQMIDEASQMWEEMAFQPHKGDRIDPAYFDKQLRLGENDMPTEVLLNEIKRDITPEQRAAYMKRARALLRSHAKDDLPEGARTPAKMRDLLLKLRQRALEAELYRRWYATSAAAILREAGDDPEKAIRLSMLFSIYSPRSAVWDPSEWNNTTRSLGAYDEFMSTGKVSSRWQTNDWQTRAANIAMKEGRWVGEGRKTSSFAQNFIKYIDPERARAIFGDVDPATIDTWMRRAFLYAKKPGKKKPKNLIEGQADLGLGTPDFGEEPITDRMYSFMEDATRVITDDLGWSIDEGQAAIWTSIKAEQEGTDLARAGVDFEYGLKDYRAQQQAKANVQELPLDFETPLDTSILPARPTGISPEASNYERTLRQWVADKLNRAHQKHGVKGGKKKMTDKQYEDALDAYYKYAHRYPDDPELQGFLDLYEKARPTFAQEFGQSDIPFHEVPEVNSGQFSDFFSGATKGEHAPRFNPEWRFDGTGAQRFYEVYKRHGGNFDAHIDTSIPDYRGMMIRKGLALSEAFPGAKVLDLMGGEGSWGKALAEHGMETVTLDANRDMQRFFKTHSRVPGARFVAQAFKDGFKDGSTRWRKYNPTERFDIVNESMGFQFISPDRDGQIAEAKRLMQPDGLFITDEKVITPKWDEFEAEKDAFKAQFYSQEQMADKAKKVLGEDSAVGMTHNMVRQDELEAALNRHFEHVEEYWVSGNFRGYIASDSKETIDRFNTEYWGRSTKAPTWREPGDTTGDWELPHPDQVAADERALYEGGVEDLPGKAPEFTPGFFTKMEGVSEKWLNRTLEEGGDANFHEVSDEGGIPMRSDRGEDMLSLTGRNLWEGYNDAPDATWTEAPLKDGDYMMVLVDPEDTGIPRVAVEIHGQGWLDGNWGTYGEALGAVAAHRKQWGLDGAITRRVNGGVKFVDKRGGGTAGASVEGAVSGIKPRPGEAVRVRDGSTGYVVRERPDGSFVVRADSGEVLYVDPKDIEITTRPASQGLNPDAYHARLRENTPEPPVSPEETWLDELARALREGDKPDGSPNDRAQEIMRALDEKGIDYSDIVDEWVARSAADEALFATRNPEDADELLSQSDLDMEAADQAYRADAGEMTVEEHLDFVKSQMWPETYRALRKAVQEGNEEKVISEIEQAIADGGDEEMLGAFWRNFLVKKGMSSEEVVASRRAANEADTVSPESADMVDFEFALPKDAQLLTSEEARNLHKVNPDYVYHGTDPATAEKIWAERRLRAIVGSNSLRGEGPMAWFAENPRIAASYADAKTYDRKAGLPGDEESRGMVIAIPRSAVPWHKIEQGGNPYGIDNPRFGGHTYSSREDILFQQSLTKILGAAEFGPGDRFTLHKAEAAGVWTIVHEMGHLLRRRLPPQQEKSIARLAGAKKNADGTYTWSREAEERFADMFVAALYGNSVGSKRILVPPAMKRHAKVIQKALKEELSRQDVVELSPKAARAFESMLDPKELKGGRFVGAEDIFADSNLVPIYVGYSRGLPTPLNESRVGRTIGAYMNRTALFTGGKRAIGRGPRDPKTEHTFKAELLGSALFENSMAESIDSVIIASRMKAAAEVRREFLATSNDLPSSPYDQPIKVDPSKDALNGSLKRFYDIMSGLDDTDLKWKPGHLEELNMEAAMAIQADLFPGVIDGEPAMDVAARVMSTLEPIPNIKWVPWEVVQRSDVMATPRGSIDSAADGALKTAVKGAGVAVDTLNDLGRAMLTYFNPAYVPMNLAGNLTMTFIHQGIWAPRNLTKAAFLHREMLPEDRTLIDTHMGTGFAENIGFSLGIDSIQRGTATIGHMLGLAIDLIPRRSAFLHEARKEGYDTVESLTRLLHAKDEKSIETLSRISGRAKEKMVDFERMSPLEKRIGRFILFYPWIRGATRYTARLAMDRPAEFALLVMLHDNAAAQAQESLGDRPSYAEETYPISTGAVGLGIPFTGKRVSLADLVGEREWKSAGGYPMTLNIRQAFPQTTPIEVMGQIADIWNGKFSWVENLSPFYQASIATGVGYDTFYDEKVPRSFGTFVNQLFGQAPLPTAISRIRETEEQRAEAAKYRINPRSRANDIARLGLGSLTPQPYNPESGQKAVARKSGDQGTVDLIDLTRKAREAGRTVPESVKEDAIWKARLSQRASGKTDEEKARIAAEVFVERYPDRAAVLDDVETLTSEEEYRWFYRTIQKYLYPDLVIFKKSLGGGE